MFFISNGAKDANLIHYEKQIWIQFRFVSPCCYWLHSGKWWQSGFHWSQLSHRTWINRFLLDFTALWWIPLAFTLFCWVGLDFNRFCSFWPSFGCHWAIEDNVFMKSDIDVPDYDDKVHLTKNWSPAKLLMNYRCEYDGLIWIYILLLVPTFAAGKTCICSID